MGGGIQNDLFCQFTANATNRPVVAGPVEASAIEIHYRNGSR